MPIGTGIIYNVGDLILSQVSGSGTAFLETKIAAATSSLIYFDSTAKINSASLNSITVGTASYVSGSTSIITNLTASNISASGTGSFGMVGIGTSSPSTKLHVRLDNAGETTLALFENRLTDFASAAAGQIVVGARGYNHTVLRQNPDLGTTPSIGGSLDTVLANTCALGSGYGKLILATQSTASLIIDYSGNVGIGTSSPAYKLDIAGGIKIGGEETLPFAIGSMYLSYNSAINRIYYGDGTGYDLRFSKRGAGATTDFVTFKDTGNVGIGTTSPSGKLEVRTNAASNYVFTGTSTSGYTTTFTMDDTAGYFGHDSAVRSLILRTNSTARLTITGDGNVGIGTTSPSNKTTIDADATGVSFADNAVAQLVIRGATDTTKRLGLGVDTTNNIGVIQAQKYGTAAYPLVLNPVGGNVGIGTSSPGYKLQAYNSSNGTTAAFGGTAYGVRIDNGGTYSSGRSTIYGVDNTFYASYQPLCIGASTLAFSISGTDKVTIDTAGNVGIGTTSPTGTYGKLSVAGGIRILDDNNAKLEIGRYSSGASNSYIKLGSNSNSLKITNNTDDADIFTIENGGNVGIGTTIPGQKLEVNGRGLFTGTTDASAGSLQVTAADAALRLKWTYSPVADKNTWDIRSVGTGATPYLQFRTVNDANTVFTDRVAFTNDGNVGIGTTDPDTVLTLEKDITYNAEFGSHGHFSVRGKTNTSKRLDIGFNTATDVGFIQAMINGTSYNNLLLNANGGNVGIGTTNPTAKLTVNQFFGFSGDKNNYIYMPDIAQGTGSIYMQAGFGSAAAGGAIKLHGHNATAYVGGDVEVGLSTKGDFLINGSIGGDRLVTVKFNGNVGIGTTSPVAKLQVAGNISGSSFTSSISNAVGFLGTSSWASNAVTSLVCTGNAATATTASYANALNAANSYTVVDVNTTGNIRLRNGDPTITLSDTNDSSSFIHVDGNYFSILCGPPNASFGEWVLPANGRWPMEINLTNNNATFGGSLDAISFTGSGSGLFGTAAGLSIGGTAATASYANALNAANTYTIAGLTSAYVDVNGSGTIPTTGIYRPSTKTLGLSADGTLIFKISNVSAPATSSIETGNFVVQSGNVGIGTTSPNKKLQIIGSLGKGLNLYEVSIDNLVAAGTQAKRFEIARVFIDYNDWNNTGAIEIEVRESYYSDGRYKRYVVSYGYASSNTGSLWLVEDTGRGSNDFKAEIGAAVQVTGDIYYVPIYIDIDYYMYVDVLVITNRPRTTNASFTAGGVIYINESPTGSNISSFSPDEVTYISLASNKTYLGYSGNVGIGTTSPGYKLDVNGPIGISGFRFVDQSTNYFRIFEPAGNIALYLGNAADPTNYYDNTSHTFRNRGGSSNYVTINSSGNVGIGTTSPASRLHVVGSEAYIRVTDSDDSGVFFIGNTSGFGYIRAFSRDFRFLNAAGTSLIDIASGGNIGIGITGPSHKLHVYGSNIRQIIESSTDSSYILMGQWDGSTNRIESNVRKLFLTSYTNGIGFGINGSENMTLNTSGNLGIGTTSPTAPLHVVGVISGSSFTGAGTGLTGTAANLTAGAVTNGVYTTGAQSVGGVKSFTSTMNVTGVRETMTTVAAATNVAINLNLGTIFKLTFSSTVSTFTITNTDNTNVAAGNSFTLISAPDNSNAKTIAFSFITNGAAATAVKWATFAGGTTPTATITSGKFDVFSFVYDGVNWYGFTGGLTY